MYDVILDIYAGTTIEQAVAEAILFSKRAGIDVSFTFNGRKLRVYPDSVYTHILDEYWKKEVTSGTP